MLDDIFILVFSNLAYFSLSACLLLFKAIRNVQLSEVGLLLHITVAALVMCLTRNFFLLALALFPQGTTSVLPLPPKGFLPDSALSLFKPADPVT